MSLQSLNKEERLYVDGSYLQMAWDDPLVWILIAAVVIFLFGSAKIPQFARALGTARKEFDQAWRSMSQPQSASGQTMPSGQVANATVSPDYAPTKASVGEDPIITAARNEGIITEGRTRQQIASDLAWKLKQKDSA
jgi:sec-independent protein translocase protein TatA